MPVRNVGHYLKAAVDSILGQTHKTLELIIIDDHSVDGSVDSLQASHKDTRIRIIKSLGDGIIDALNTGVAEAKHPIIARMDGDDIAHPMRIESQLAYLKHNADIDIVGGCVRIFKDDGEPAEGYQLYEKWINSLCEHQHIVNSLFIESPIPHPTALFHKHTIEQLGGYQDNGWPEDYDLWCRALIRGLRFGKPNVPALLDWRDYQDRTSRQDPRYGKKAFIKCKSYYLASYLKEHKGITQCTIWGAGPTGLQLHDGLEENGISVSKFFDINLKLDGKTKRKKSVIVYRPKNDFPLKHTSDSICIIAVGSRGASSEMRKLLNSVGWIENKHYLFAA